MQTVVEANRTRSIRLGDLEPAVQHAAAAAGQGVSHWIRGAIERALDVIPEHSISKAGMALADAAGGRARATLRTTPTNLERWQHEAMEEGVSLSRYVELQMLSTADSRHRMARALSELRSECVVLAAISRQLSQLNRRLQHDDGLTEADRREIGWICATLDALKSTTSALVAAMTTATPSR